MVMYIEIKVNVNISIPVPGHISTWLVGPLLHRADLE